MANDKRVVITGLGIISPAGLGKEENWSNFIAGKSGIDTIAQFDASQLPVKMAGEVKGFTPREFIKDRKSLKIMYRNVQLGLTAAKLAIDDSGLETDKVDPLRFGAIIGSGGGGFDEGPGNIDLAEVIKISWDENKKNFDPIRFGSIGIEKIYPLWLLKTLPNNVFCYISIYYNAQGVNDNVITSFTGGSQAIGDAFNAIKRGDADIMIAGGYDSLVMPNNIFSFHSLDMLSKDGRGKSSFRPFDRLRDGFVPGEGAAMLILEELYHAKKRDARIYGEIIGYGNASSGFHLYRPSPDGRGLVSAIKMACKDSRINLTEIDYINADGIATRESDRAETYAIKKVFSERAYKMAVTATKPITGHTGAASGAIEIIVTLLAINKGIILPTINLENPDPECDLDYCPVKAREKQVHTALSLNQGFGGQNAALIIKRCEK